MSERKYADGYRKLRPADEPRRIAYEVLYEVCAQGAFANIMLPKALRRVRREGNFSDRDAAFTSELVHGTLRAIGRLDWVIARHVNRPLVDLDPRVLVLVRMGAHQLLDMRVPDHAAVSATVDVAREHLTDGPVRFVNAVLRSITRESSDEREAAMAAIADEDEDEALGVRYSHPTWMVRAFREALAAHGYSTDELEDVLAADNEVPTVTLVVRPALMGVDELADEAEDILDTRVALGAISPRAVLLESGDPARLPSIRDGRSGAQDEGSQLAALIAAHAPLDGGADERWLDLCAGPGGKAAMLAGLAQERGARVTANEVHPHRARLIERTTRLYDSIEVVSGDGRSFGGGRSAWPLASFDRVVVDAPCSGMGSLRRRPESRWNRTPADVEELTKLQAELLDRAVALTRPGGVLTYITCSPHAAETRDQVARLLEGGDVDLCDTVALADECAPFPLGVPDAAGRLSGVAGRTLQLWDHRFGTDLMFVACLRRR